MAALTTISMKAFPETFFAFLIRESKQVSKHHEPAQAKSNARPKAEK